MAVVAGVLGRAGQKGKERRLRDASRGSVPWDTSPELTRHMNKEVQAAVSKRKEVMGRTQSNVQGFTEEEQKLLRLRNSEVDLKVTEDDMVNMMGQAALHDASDVTETAEHVPSDLEWEQGSVGQRLADIESQLGQISQQTTHIELAMAEKNTNEA